MSLKTCNFSSFRRLEHVLKTSSVDKDEIRLQDVFKMYSSRWMFTGPRWFLKLLEIDFRLAFSLDFLPKNQNFHNLGYWSSLQHRQRNYSFLLPLFHCLLAKNHFLQWGVFFRIWISYFLIRWTEQFFRKFRYMFNAWICEIIFSRFSQKRKAFISLFAKRFSTFATSAHYKKQFPNLALVR